jgi:chromate reductase, NAD(P)H dehydrogenase (quinone)
MQGIRLLIIPGSARAASLNRKLAAAAAVLAQEAGASVEEIDLRALALPLYDADIESASGVPESALRLQGAISAADALLVVSPEYNGFPPPLLLNAFDWLSRSAAQGARPSGLAATTNKPVALLSASPGLLGGLRATNQLRQYFQMAFAMIVVPQQFALSRAHEAFDERGEFTDEKTRRAVEGALAALGALAGALRDARQADGA